MVITIWHVELYGDAEVLEGLQDMEDLKMKVDEDDELITRNRIIYLP